MDAPDGTTTDPIDLGGEGRAIADEPVFTPVCSPLDPNPSGCRSRGTHWAAEETGEALVQSARATQVVLVEAFWWLFVLGFFGWRRRRWSKTPPVNLI